MTRRRLRLTLLGLTLLGWILGAEWVSIHRHVPENHFIDALGGLAFLAAGLVAIDRRPGNRLGMLMLAYVVVSYLGNWGNLRVPVAPMIGLTAQTWGGPFLAQMVLSYPSGQLRTRFERVAVAAAYGIATAVSVVVVVAFDPQADGCVQCPWEPAMFPSRSAVQAATLLGQRAEVATYLLVMTALWLRWRRATPAERRTLGALWLAACVYVVIGLMGAFSSPDPLADPFSYLVWELQSVLQISLPAVFVWGLLSARMARSAVGDLVLDLGRPLPPGELRASLARVLADPSLEVLYARDGLDGWVAADGQPRALPGAGDSQRRMVTVVDRDRQPLSALIHDPALDQALVRAAAAATGMALENERLQAEVRAQLEEVRASRERIVAAGDAERRRVERNLHDGAQQRMMALALSLAMLRDRAGDDLAMVASLDAAVGELRQAITELRELARGIHPAILTEEGLLAAVEALADRSALPVRVESDHDDRMPWPIEAAAYFVVAESLANVAKHACATGASIKLSRRSGMLRVEVTDNGIGGADAAGGSGLRGLADRVAAVRGSFTVESPPEGGTRVVAELPCDA